MTIQSLIVFGDEHKITKGKIGYHNEKGEPVVVADVNQYKDVIADPLAVANLLAAAPDMLEALEYCLDCLGSEFALPLDCIDEVCAAIAKAKGLTP